MEIVVFADAAAASRHAADVVADLLRRRPDAVLGLATGSTPERLYAELVRRHQEEDLSFAAVRTFNLDEYLGLPPDHPESYRAFMERQLFSKVDLDPGNVNIPNGLTEDPRGEGAAYERAIRAAGGIDLQVLGIGGDGHIGFNEPSSSLGSRTRIKTLTPQTVRDNARFFDSEEEVPRHVLTMGVGTILEAREVLLLAFGEKKAGAVEDAVEGPITATCPASALQMHRSARVILDEAAASQLARREYYQWVFENKPEWQRP
jgi:glucosamine-6-phosphate deaminase